MKIVRLIGRNTIEEIILKRAEQKLQLTATVMSSGKEHNSIVADENEVGLNCTLYNNVFLHIQHVSCRSLFACLCTAVNVVLIQLQEILKFGLDKLLAADESGSKDIDFTRILGTTVNGQWDTEGTLVSDMLSLTLSKLMFCSLTGCILFVTETKFMHQ